MQVPFLDLKAHSQSVWSEVRAALDPVMTEAQFILGPAVARALQNLLLGVAAYG